MNLNPYNKIFQKLGNNLQNIIGNLKKFLSDSNNREKFLSGLKDGKFRDDIVIVKRAAVTAKALRPSQDAIFLKKIIGNLVTYETFRDSILSGIIHAEDIFISSDGFVIDGHHRWATTMSINPKAVINCTMINLPIKMAIPILNAILLLTNKFKPGAATGNNIWGQLDHLLIQDTIIDKVDNGNNSAQASPPELFEKTNNSTIITPGGKALDEFYKLIYKKNFKLAPQFLYLNIKKIPKPLKIFPKRNQMPQIDSINQIDRVLKTGKLDLRKPFVRESQLIEMNLVLEKLRLKTSKWKQQVLHI